MNKYDLEAELKASELVSNKIRSNPIYAQNMYAALCNMQWCKADVWPILTEDYWSCSWRYAGGLVAEIVGEGDYLSYYCSGINNEDEDATRKTVSEGTVTDEIREDLNKLGWVPKPYDDDKGIQ